MSRMQTPNNVVCVCTGRGGGYDQGGYGGGGYNQGGYGGGGGY